MTTKFVRHTISKRKLFLKRGLDLLILLGKVLKKPPEYERMVACLVEESVLDVEILKVGQ